MTEPRTAPAAARYECKVCWHVYDPVQGDMTWQVVAGTPFAALPPHWACPVCSTPKADFLLLADDE
jgi:rubredoxin